MKEKVGPIAVVLAIIGVAVFAFLVYRISFAPRQSNVSADNIPDYVKKMRAGGQAGPAYGPAGGGSGSTTGGVPAYVQQMRQGGQPNMGYGHPGQ